MVPSIELITWPSCSPTNTTRVRRNDSCSMLGPPDSCCDRQRPGENAFYSVARAPPRGRTGRGALRWGAGARRRRPRRRGRRHHRPDRAERRRQDHALQRHLRAPGPRVGPHPPGRRRPRGREPAPPGPARDRPHVPAPRGVRLDERARQHPGGGGGAAHVGAGRPRRGGHHPGGARRPRSSSSSGWRTLPTIASTRCPPGWPASSRSGEPSPRSPGSSSSTSRPPASASRRPTTSPSCWRRWPPAASGSSSWSTTSSW